MSNLLPNAANYSESGRKPKKRPAEAMPQAAFQTQNSSEKVSSHPQSVLSSQEYNPNQQYRFINILPNSLDTSSGTTPDRGPPAQFKNQKGPKKVKSESDSFIKRKRIKKFDDKDVKDKNGKVIKFY